MAIKKRYDECVSIHTRKSTNGLEEYLQQEDYDKLINAIKAVRMIYEIKRLDNMLSHDHTARFFHKEINECRELINKFYKVCSSVFMQFNLKISSIVMQDFHELNRIHTDISLLMGTKTDIVIRVLQNSHNLSQQEKSEILEIINWQDRILDFEY